MHAHFGKTVLYPISHFHFFSFNTLSSSEIYHITILRDFWLKYRPFKCNIDHKFKNIDHIRQVVDPLAALSIPWLLRAFFLIWQKPFLDEHGIFCPVLTSFSLYKYQDYALKIAWLWVKFVLLSRLGNICARDAGASEKRRKKMVDIRLDQWLPTNYNHLSLMVGWLKKPGTIPSMAMLT